METKSAEETGRVFSYVCLRNSKTAADELNKDIEELKAECSVYIDSFKML